MARWEIYVDVIVATIFIFSILVGFIFTLRRRSLHPLRQRSLLLICTTPILGILFMVGVTLRSSEIMPCNITSWLLYLVFVIFEISWLASAYRTYFRWKIEEGKLILSDSPEDKAISILVGEMVPPSNSFDKSPPIRYSILTTFR